jgi:hypothetical protein
MSLQSKLKQLVLQPKDELAVGILVEREHSESLDVAKKIATDHLKEDKHYYSKLYNAGLVDESGALNLINRLKE